MDILPSHIHKVFNETKSIFSRKIIPVPKIALFFVETQKFLEAAKADPFNQFLVEYGLIKDFENEYPNFAVVYEYDKSPLTYLLRGCYGVSVSYELAKKWLNPFTTQQAYDYLRHVFAHEITHILESEIRDKFPYYVTDVSTGKLDREAYAEYIADMVEGGRQFKFVETKLWENIRSRAKYGGDKI